MPDQHTFGPIDLPAPFNPISSRPANVAACRGKSAAAIGCTGVSRSVEANAETHCVLMHLLLWTAREIVLVAYLTGQGKTNPEAAWYFTSAADSVVCSEVKTDADRFPSNR